MMISRYTVVLIQTLKSIVMGVGKAIQPMNGGSTNGDAIV